MTKDHFKLGESSYIRVESCGGSLTVRGWAEAGVQIRGEYRVEETAKGIKLETHGNLHLDLPREAMLSIGRVNGELVVKQFTGATTAEYIHGDAVFSQTGDVDLGIVHGDLVARNLVGMITADEVNGDVTMRVVGGAVLGAIHGDLTGRVVDGNFSIDTINGDADLRTINGNVTVNQGFRDINLNSIGGQVSVAGIMGDIRLRGGLAPGDHALEARGDIVVRWPSGTPVNFALSGARIDNRLNLEDVIEKPGSLLGRIGNGGANLSLSTSGRVILREQEPVDEKWAYNGGDMDFDIGVNMNDIAARIEAEVNTHLSRVSRELESKFGADFSQKINEKVTRKVEKATEKARRRSEQRGRFTGFDFSEATAEPPRKSVSPEEQLRILKMVETGKISPEEAGMLLEALDS